ncbi:hypothetical protein GJAV_G00170570 [Gymnothorax javanicus]|nr:hypothetical protein GJAV_G00170570 [Gymnothorax javanicus]
MLRRGGQRFALLAELRSVEERYKFFWGSGGEGVKSEAPPPTAEGRRAGQYCPCILSFIPPESVSLTNQIPVA